MPLDWNVIRANKRRDCLEAIRVYRVLTGTNFTTAREEVYKILKSNELL